MRDGAGCSSRVAALRLRLAPVIVAAGLVGGPQGVGGESVGRQCVQMTEDSHAWGGVHSAHWNADQLAPGSVTVNGNTYQASQQVSAGVGQPGFGNIDKYSYESAQKWCVGRGPNSDPSHFPTRC